MTTDPWNFDDEDEQPEQEPEQQPEPKLRTSAELDPDPPKLRKNLILGTAAAVAVLAIGGGVFAAKQQPSRPLRSEREVIRPTKIQEAPAAFSEPPKSTYKRKEDDEGLPDSTLTAVAQEPVATPDVGTYDDESPAAAAKREQARMCAEGDCKGAGAKYMGAQARVERHDDESATEQAPPPMEVWGKRGPGQVMTSTAPGAFGMQPSLPAVAPAQLPQGVAEALANAANKDHGDGDDIKEAFAARSGNLDSQEVERELGECELVAGTPITAANITAINSDVPAQASIKVSVTQDLFCGADRQYVAIPAGSEFTASANSRVTYGDNRLQVCMVQLRRPPSKDHPNGSLLPIKGCWAAVEVDGSTGWIADVDNHWSQLIAGVALSTFLSLGTQASAGNQEGFAPSIAQRAASGASNQISQAGQRIVQRDLMRKPTLTRDMLTAAQVVITTNQPLTPWVPVVRKRLRRW